jgi:hypothetical protein
VLALAIVGTAAAAAVMLLSVPVRVEGRAWLAPSFDWYVRVQWAFARFERSSDRPRARSPARKRRAGRAPPPRHRAPLWTERATWFRSVRLVRALAARVQLHDFNVVCTFGLDDPADTGTLYGALAPVLAAVEARHPAALVVTPGFDGARLDGRVALAARVVPLRLVGPLAAFGLWLGMRAWRARTARA